MQIGPFYSPPGRTAQLPAAAASRAAAVRRACTLPVAHTACPVHTSAASRRHEPISTSSSWSASRPSGPRQRASQPFCIGTALSVRFVRGAQNGFSCRAAYPLVNARRSSAIRNGPPWSNTPSQPLAAFIVTVIRSVRLVRLICTASPERLHLGSILRLPSGKYRLTRPGFASRRGRPQVVVPCPGRATQDRRAGSNENDKPESHIPNGQRR
jgi:hypothetical protein